MYYEEDFVEEVRQRSDVVDIISSYVNLKRTGSNYVGLCPFHNEKTASFSVSPSKQMYYCFGCGAGGNVFTFLMEYENLTFVEALERLAEQAGMELPEKGNSENDRKRRDLRDSILEVNKLAANYYFACLKSEQGKIGYEYLTKRELKPETIVRFGLGFAGKGGSPLYQYVKSKGYPDSVLKETGLFTYDEKRGVYDKFWNRVMFPILDRNNRVIAFGGRVMGDAKPKYLNSPETMVFDKSRNLYGLNFVHGKQSEGMIICEGYMDVIALHQAGFTNAVASLGTAFTSQHCSLLKRYTDLVYLCYDSDGAGVKAAMRAIPMLKEAGIRVKVINMRPYKDPDEFIKALGGEEFQKRLDHAENSFFFELRQLQKNYDLSDPEQKTAFHREIARKLCTFSEEVERENYIEAVAQKYHISFETLRGLVGTYAAQTGLAQPVIRPKSGVQKKNTAAEGIKNSQKLLLTWLVEQPQLYRQISKYISPKDFTEGLYEKVADRLFEELEQGNINPASIISMFEEEEDQREAASLFHTKLERLESTAEQEKALHDIVCAVKRNSYERDSAQLGTDVAALNRVIAGKKQLEELAKTHISLE